MDGTLDIPTILSNASIFSGVDEGFLGLISAISTVMEYNAGDVIFDQGSDGDELYVIASGEVDIQIDQSLIGDAEEGEMITITTVRRGQSFGEIALVDSGARSASACCGQMNTQLVIIPRDGLLNLCEEQSKLGFQLMRNLAIDLALTIRNRTTDLQIREWLTWAHAHLSG